MNKSANLQKRVAELAVRAWDVQGIRNRLEALRKREIAPKQVDWPGLLAKRPEVLDRVQLRAEEYEYLTHSCAKGSLLALMDEFNLGTWDLVRAMSPFPGFGMTGGICGGVTGPMIALGLFFGSDDPEDYQGTGRTMEAARAFIARFKQELGTIMCPQIQEDTIFGRYMDPRASQENFAAFQKALGYEKCALPPGIGARLAAEIILDSKPA
ncbi:MAG: C-GCAxxG-C-C family protein [Deltaproteobacteria bacterium]|nr:C-GCAxxG-C-C family protein [Deltaproteobacteria bacterium]